MHLTLKIALPVLLALVPAALRADPIPLSGHDGRGVPFALHQLRGQVVAVTFASRYTQKEAAQVNGALGDRARRGQVAVVSIVDFVGIPGLFHGFARRKVAENDRPDRVKLLVDERSGTARWLGADPKRRVDILVLDRDGALRGRYQGAGGLPEATRLIERLLAAPRDAYAAAAPR